MLFGKSIKGWIAIAISVIIATSIMVVSIIRTPSVAEAKQAVSAVSTNATAAEDAAENEAETMGAAGNETEEVSEFEAPGQPDTGEAEETEEEAKPEAPEWNFFNLELQDNGDAKDDYNFGPNPIFMNISLEQVKEAIKGKDANDTVKVSDLFSEVEVEEIDKDFRNRLRADPALGAADMAWFDSLLGTRYLGVFYDECDEEWDKAMNAAKEAWIEDYEDYFDTLDAFERYLDSATKVEVVKVDKRLDDQMYMNPYTKDGIPDIIVMETKDHDGYYLKYTFTIKETKTVEVTYRIDCGYQPTNVAKIMKIKAKKRSSGGGGGTTGGGGAAVATTGWTLGGGGGSSSGGGGNPGGNPPGTNPPGGNPYNKDNSKGTQVLPNDTDGPGPNTNNGVGAQYSTEDQSTNSNHMTQAEYTQAINQITDANAAAEAADQAASTGGATTPPPSSDTTVDSNGSSDSGYTETSSSDVSDDDAADSWDGPAD